MAQNKDFYAVLGVSASASPDEIKKQYRKLAKRYHPDANQGDAKASERFKEISEAYTVLGDADKRKIVNGKLTPVGNTVDVARATWSNTIGDPELVAVWKDPDFDPTLRAFYYARVLEIPTPRWTAYDAAYFKIKITDPKVPMTTQERAFTSPIWYTPAK